MRDFILLAMSTPNASVYELIEEDRYAMYKTPENGVIDGVRGQLEPIVRYYLSLCDEDVTVITMCTLDTLKANKKLDNGLSALSYFYKRILASPEAAGKNIEFVDNSHKPMDVNLPMEVLQWTVTELKNRFIHGQSRLFVDTHGGIRDVSLIISAIISLLHHDGIIPERICGCAGPGSDIKNQDRAFTMFSFVSSMEDFLNHGDADALRRYFTGLADSLPEFFKAMQMIADGTRFCDPASYTEGLQLMPEAMQKAEKWAEEQMNSKEKDSRRELAILLNLFLDNIKRDYGELLEPGRMTCVNIVRRCIHKRQFQQALTFVEAGMAKYYADHKVLYVNENDRSLLQASIRRYEAVENVILDECIRRHVVSINDAGMCACINAVGEAENPVPTEQLQRLIFKAQNMNPPKRIKYLYHHPERLYFTIRREDKTENEESVIKIHVHTDVDIDSKEDAEMLERVFLFHDLLKRSRNKFNHGISEYRPQLHAIIKTLEQYLEIAEKLAQAVQAREGN